MSAYLTEGTSMNPLPLEGVTLGLVLPPFDEPARIYAAARMAEAHDFHSVWAPDATLPGYPYNTKHLLKFTGVCPKE